MNVKWKVLVLSALAVWVGDVAHATSCMGTPMQTVDPTPVPGEQPDPGNGSSNDWNLSYGTPGNGNGNGNGGGSGGGGGGSGGGGGNPSDPNNTTWGTCNGSPASSNGLHRMDSDKVNWKYSAYLGQDNSIQSAVQTFSDVWGSNDPADIPSGYASQFYLTLGCYVSLQFTPQTEGKVTFSSNASYGSGGAYSVSTSPGGFDTSTSLPGCLMTFGGLNNLGMIITSPGEEVANPAIASIPGCHLEIGKTYYLNISPDNGGMGCNTGASQSCAVATEMQVNRHSWANYNPLG